MSTSDQKGWRDPRPIVERIIIKGNLILQTAAHFGSGDVEPFSHIDMLLLRDSLENKPLLPGASIAGALRNYLRERLEGYRAAEKADSVVTRLFGVSKGRTGGVQSALIVNDALSAGGTARIELRDGVKIDPQTRTAEEGAKFDLEVLAAGTVFPLHFELALEADEQNELKRALALTLQGLQNGDIHLGARKQRGYGRVNVTNWQVWAYNLQQRGDLLAWLAAERPDLTPQPAPKKGADIVQLLLADTGEAGLEDKRHYFRIQGTFALNGSLLIRAGFGLDPNGPDTLYLHARQPDGNPAPLIPGTSLAGVLRHRARRIANTLLDEAAASALVNGIFGHADKQNPKQSLASRVRVRDTAIQKTQSLVQSRIRVDRFTGGAHTTALFNEQPVFGRANAGENDSELCLDLTLINPQDAEIGLLLHTLKDLWVGDLPVGGGSSVGRGRLQGKSAELTRRNNNRNETWTITQAGQKLTIEGNRETLESFSNALHLFDPETSNSPAGALNRKGGASQ